MSHPPIANKVAAVDFDGTLTPWGPLNGPKPVSPEIVEAMVALREAGYRIVIFTSRASMTWWRAERPNSPFTFGQDQMDLVRNALADAGVPFDDITAEKVPAEVYFDDKAWQVSESYPLDECITDFLRG